MTREEIRNNAATNYGYAVAGGCIERGYIQDAFERGAEWADVHPVNPWHKASEELPKVDKRKCIKVFASTEDGVFVAFYSVVAGFSLSSSFYAEYALYGVTHWMEIPEIKEELI